MANKPECFGTILPDLDRLEHNRPCQGKAFTVRIDCQGVGVQARQVLVDQAQWDACQECPVYASCRDQSLMRLALWRALREG